jgi:flavin reductase (DIM6/NTAB) family NADH-FMN oxidoreductase RutF
MFSSNQTFEGNRKDSVCNVESTGEFVWNMATWDLREAVNASAEAVPADVDEFEKVGLEKEQAGLVNVPMVKKSPIKFECKYYSTLRLPGNPPLGSVDVVIGRVIGVHISEDVLTDGLVDLGKAMPIARCGYYQYAVVRPDSLFEMIVPGDPKMLIGLEGNAKGNRALAEGEKAEGDTTNGQK